jgi:transglutaminase-like putative cysteine protease
MGDVITLKGINFGAERDESYITIAGTAPTNSSYFAWEDDAIMVRVPESGESGLVYVHVNGKKSNGVLFSNSASVPKPIEGESLGTEPRIISINPQTGMPGTVITITGNNFGGSRENGGVFFSVDYESAAINPFLGSEPDFIEVSETEFGYESWNIREIRVRVPDGAASGNLEVRTPRGKSRPALFNISGKPGTKVFLDKLSYTVSYSVDIRVLEATKPNTLYLWMPKPASSPSQRNIILLSRNAEPFMENHRGVDLFKLDNLGTGFHQAVNLSYRVEVCAQETVIKPLSIKQDAETFPVYTQSSSLVPSNTEEIKKQANTLVGKEKNPYLKTKLIYEWLVASMLKYDPLAEPASNILSALEQKRFDSYNAALLFTAMARASGVPCIPVAGVLIDRNMQTMRHYWAEFWIDGFGWIPADPAMGARAVPSDFIIKQDAANYYFGNMDSQRIAFSRGELNLSQMDSRGRLVSRPRSYSLQNIWEEAVGGLESYSSLWGDIIITGVYVQ